MYTILKHLYSYESSSSSRDAIAQHVPRLRNSGVDHAPRNLRAVSKAGGIPESSHQSWKVVVAQVQTTAQEVSISDRLPAHWFLARSLGNATLLRIGQCLQKPVTPHGCYGFSL